MKHHPLKEFFCKLICFGVVVFFLSSKPFVQASDTLYESKIHCDRFFKMGSKILHLDSGRKNDGEGLRPYLKENPDAIDLLNDYQKLSRKTRWLAFTGTLGIGTIIASTIVSSHLGDTVVKQRNARWAFLSGGILLTGGSYAWGQWLIRSNESKLNQAVDLYNQKAPEDKKIQLGFEYDPSINTGQIKTEVQL